MENLDVLIVGSGPTGLMAAALCARSGLRCRIIDQSVQQAHESRALAVQSRTLELFANMGLAEKALERGQIARGVSLFLNGEEKVHINFGDIGRKDTAYPYVFLLSQAETEKILVADLAERGVAVEHETRLEDFTDTGHRVQARVRRQDGTTEEISAAFLLGCDGAHSRVRHGLGLNFEGGAYPDDFLLADARVDWDLPHDRVQVFLGAENIALFFPIKGAGVSRVFALAPPSTRAEHDESVTTSSAPTTITQVEKTFAKAVGRPVKLHDETWFTRFHIHHRGVDRYRVGRVFVVGDAAHVHSPVGGQGMNTGLQDAANLIWKLRLCAKDIAGDSLLETYHSERYPVGQKLLRLTDRAFQAVTSHGQLRNAIRNALVPLAAQLMNHLPEVRRRAFQFVSQLGIRYHASEAAIERAGAGMPRGPRAGERFPDAELAGGRRLLKLTSGYRFHLVLVTREILDPARTQSLLEELEAEERGPLLARAHLLCPKAAIASERVVEAGPEVFARLGVDTSAIFLVRPDGYIAERRVSLNFAGIGSELTSKMIEKRA